MARIQLEVYSKRDYCKAPQASIVGRFPSAAPVPLLAYPSVHFLLLAYRNNSGAYICVYADTVKANPNPPSNSASKNPFFFHT